MSPEVDIYSYITHIFFFNRNGTNIISHILTINMANLLVLDCKPWDDEWLQTQKTGDFPFIDALDFEELLKISW